MVTPTEPIQYQQITSGQPKDHSGEAIVEMPVALTVNGETWLTLMSTPVDLEALAVGFLFNEGVINTQEEIADVRVCPAKDNVDIWLNHGVGRPARWSRTSGCGGGMTAVENYETLAGMDFFKEGEASAANGWKLAPAQITHLVVQLFEAQDLYRQSGGVHTSALSDGEKLWIVAEDVGRHNTLDKIAGKMLLEDVQPPNRLILSTGRISSDMLQKAARMGAGMIVSRTAPTSLSIELAHKWGVTLIGYARRERFNLYTHPERVQIDD